MATTFCSTNNNIIYFLKWRYQDCWGLALAQQRNFTRQKWKIDRVYKRSESIQEQENLHLSLYKLDFIHMDLLVTNHNLYHLLCLLLLFWIFVWMAEPHLRVETLVSLRVSNNSGNIWEICRNMEFIMMEMCGNTGFLRKETQRNLTFPFVSALRKYAVPSRFLKLET